jgi:hypothetical protein
MPLNPLPLVAILLLTYTFTFLLSGDELLAKFEDQAEAPETPDQADCGALDFVCGITKFIDWVKGLFRPVFAAMGLIWSLVTFDVAGAPIYIRVPLTGFVVVAFSWSIATLIRGN